MKLVPMLAAAAAAAAALALPGAGGADTPVLFATVGTPTSPVAQQISLSTTPGGPRLTHIDPGTYLIQVQDYATIHNFHLFGPGGVDKSTDIEFTGGMTWTVTFLNGTYTYQCDAHPTTMHQTFTVGTVLHGQVGPKRTISLRNQSRAKVTSLPAGSYPLIVKDASRTDNFHLTGPGVNKKTGVGARGTVSWRLSLKTGTYRFRSDAHKRLRGSFTVK